MRTVVSLLAAILLAVFLVAEEMSRHAARATSVDGCLACHAQVSDPSPAHPVAVLGCAPCHGGNRHSRDKRRAHSGMFSNPGDLAIVDQTCGQSSCHPDQAARIKQSIMTTNAGMLASLTWLWGSAGQAMHLDATGRSMADMNMTGPPRDYYAKMCSGCHFRRPRTTGGREFDQRGGGCSGCHVVGAPGERDEGLHRLAHSPLSLRVPMANCVRCHNRSARIGLTYQGQLEDDGYGTPHQDGGPNRRQLSGGRSAIAIPADAHFLAGMVCIDCHTGLEIMGDGTAHATLKDQLEIRCRDCHEPQFTRNATAWAEAVRLSGLNRRVPPAPDGSPAEKVLAVARKGSPLYALRQVLAPVGKARPGVAVLYRKLDGAPLTMTLHAPPLPHHSLPGHERLACQACHSPFMPQCFGCHATLRLDLTQRDHMLDRDTPGRWDEARSFTRFEAPALGLAGGRRVMPFSPCQVAVSVYDGAGVYGPAASRGKAGMTSFDPHSTQNASRTCLDCHLEPRAMGLGSGRFMADGGLAVRQTYDATASGFGWTSGPDQLTRLSGQSAQAFPHPGDRPFNAAELRAILGVAPCLPCHDGYDAPLWRAFKTGRQQWARGLAPGCSLPPPRGRTVY